MKSRIIEIDEIKKYLPHRYPFLFVDRVLEFNDAYIKGVKNVSANENFFMGHFPERPVMPGVLMIEALAQVSGIYALLRMEEEKSDFANMLTLFTGINNVRFKRPVRPGDILTLESNFIKRKMSIWWFSCVASVDGEVACTADLSAALK